METTTIDVRLVRDGSISWHSAGKLGFERVIRGGYSKFVGDDRRTRWLTKVRAVVKTYAHLDVVLYGATALQALGVALPERLQDWDTVHILVKGAGRRPSRAGVVAHCDSRRTQVWKMVEGLPVLHPVDHWLQLQSATVNEMVEVGDGFLRRRDPLLSFEQLTSRLDKLGGVARVTMARRALKLVRANTDSLYETRTRLTLVDAGLPTPAVNVPVPYFGRTYHVDMGYERARVAVEYDGLVHVGDRRQMELDANRRRDLQDAGWLVITVTADQLRRPSDVIRSVENALMIRTGQWS